MRKLLFIATLAFVGLGNVNAQEQVVKFNPLAILGGTDLVSYERAVGGKSSIQVSGAIGGFKIGDVKYSSVGGELQYRYYFSEVLKGWYVSGGLGVQSGETEFTTLSLFEDSSKEKIDFFSFNIGARAGYQWIWDSGFSFELNLGLGYRSFDYDDNSNSSILKASGILPSGSLALGYAW